MPRKTAHAPGVLLLLAAGFLWLAANPAGAAEQVSVDQAVRAALEFDSRVGAAEEALSATREGVRQIYGRRLPTISGTGEFSVLGTQDLNVDGTQQQDGSRYYGGVQLRQQLITFGRQGARQNVASAEVTKASQELLLMQQTVAMETIEAFLETRLAVEFIGAYENHTATLNQLLEATEAKHDSDLATAIEVLLVRSRVQQARAQLTNARAELNLARNRILSLTGVDFGELTDISEDLGMRLGLLDLDEAGALASIYAPELAIARAEEEIARGRVKLEKAELYPSAELVGRALRGRTNGRSIGSDSIGIVINVPLYDGGVQRSRSRASRHRLKKAQRQVTFVQQRTRQLITGAWHQAKGAGETLEAWERALASEMQSLEGIREQVEEDLRPITFLLEARDQAVEVETRTIRARHALSLSQFNFINESGTLLVALLTD